MVNNEVLKKALDQIKMRKLAAAPDVPTLENPGEYMSPEEQTALQAAIAQQGPQNVEQPAPPTGAEATPGAGEPGDQVSQVLPMLLAAYNAEVCAAWQYEWARIAALGKARNYLVSECEEHRYEEWEHAQKLAEMIDFLGGTVPFTLTQIEAQNPTPSPQEDPSGNRDTIILAHQLVEAEEQAVQLYSEIIAATQGGDADAAIVNNLVVDILTTEKKHVADMIKVVYAIEQQ